MKKNINHLPFSAVYFTNEWAKIDSLTIDKKSVQSFIVPTALLTGGIFLLNSVQIIPFRKNLIPFWKRFSTSIDDFTPLVPLAQIYAGRYMGFKPKNTIYHQTVDIVIANSLTLAVVQITKNLVKKKGRMAQIILVSIRSYSHCLH
jgi:hypothetical protein